MRPTAGNNLDIWVQQLQTGEARRLTTNPADDHDPDFSPDGSQILFRSERDGGGIYLISTLGGVERKIADGGHNRKFSPDGASIAYWLGAPVFRGLSPGRIMVMPSRGGESREVTAGNFRGIAPVWSPDGKHLFFLGFYERKFDSYVTPLGGGAPVATGRSQSSSRTSLPGLRRSARGLMTA